MNNFTGTITVGNTKEMSSSRITFEAGARTHGQDDSPSVDLVLTFAL